MQGAEGWVIFRQCINTLCMKYPFLHSSFNRKAGAPSILNSYNKKQQKQHQHSLSLPLFLSLRYMLMHISVCVPFVCLFAFVTKTLKCKLSCLYDSVVQPPITLSLQLNVPPVNSFFATHCKLRSSLQVGHWVGIPSVSDRAVMHFLLEVFVCVFIFCSLFC